QSASGSSRELDAEIAARLRIVPDDATDWLRNWTGPFVPISAPGRLAAMHTDGSSGINWESKRYTEIVNDAMTLVPEGLLIAITIGHGATVARIRTGTILDPATKEWEGYSTATPAIALVIACLKTGKENSK